MPDVDTRPLTEEGLRQAEALVDELKRFAPTAVLSSPQTRAIQTVHPTADALSLPVVTWPELREWESGLLPSADWEARYTHSWADPAHAYENGESLDELTERAGRALRRIAREYPGTTVLVGSHGTILTRALVAAGQDVGWDYARALPMPAIREVTVG